MHIFLSDFWCQNALKKYNFLIISSEDIWLFSWITSNSFTCFDTIYMCAIKELLNIRISHTLFFSNLLCNIFTLSKMIIILLIIILLYKWFVNIDTAILLHKCFIYINTTIYKQKQMFFQSIIHFNIVSTEKDTILFGERIREVAEK